MKFFKKAQGLSLKTIIIAAVVLIVLIVLWSIFTGKMGGFSEELTVCRDKCSSNCKAEAPEGHEDCIVNGGTYDKSNNELVYSAKPEVCCLVENV